MRRTVILANGAFPRRNGAAWKALASAARVVCCDGAADAYSRRFRRQPYAVVGDCDSVRGRYDNIVRIDDQETNDLSKAIAYCRAKRLRNPIVLGAVGKCEDHALGNIFRALDAGLDVLTDYGLFAYVRGRRSFAVTRGARVSVFATDRKTRMTSSGLEWPLREVRFETLYCATLNRATGSRVNLTATHPAIVYFET